MAKPSKIETRKSATIAGTSKARVKKHGRLINQETGVRGYDVGYGRPPQLDSVQTEDERQSQRAGRRQPAARKDR